MNSSDSAAAAAKISDLVWGWARVLLTDEQRAEIAALIQGQDASAPTARAKLIADIEAEVLRARAKFPTADLRLPALMEEVGEVSRALHDEPWENVVAEATQVAAMAIRVAEEGDIAFDERRRALGLELPPCRRQAAS